MLHVTGGACRIAPERVRVGLPVGQGTPSAAAKTSASIMGTTVHQKKLQFRKDSARAAFQEASASEGLVVLESLSSTAGHKRLLAAWTSTNFDGECHGSGSEVISASFHPSLHCIRTLMLEGSQDTALYSVAESALAEPSSISPTIKQDETSIPKGTQTPTSTSEALNQTNISCRPVL